LLKQFTIFLALAAAMGLIVVSALSINATASAIGLQVPTPPYLRLLPLKT
jgi:hypothetical protein